MKSNFVSAALAFLLLMSSAEAANKTLEDWARQAFGAGPGSAAAALDDAFLSTAKPPFSFRYNGASSSASLPTWWQDEENNQTHSQTVRTKTWTDPKTGLEVKATVTAYRDFPAVEWVLNFTNTGKQDTPILEDVQALDETLGTVPAAQSLILRQIAGSDASERDFAPSERTIKSSEEVAFAAVGGRPSNQVFPFFNLQSGDGGVIVAIGWTGQWKAQIQRGLQGETRVRAGMELTHLRLHPGETIRTPSILLLRWAGGDWINAQNQFRRLLLAHYIPRRDGKPMVCPVAAQSFDRWYPGDAGKRLEWCTERGQIQCARINQELGCDTLWLDAAWFTGNFPNGAGNWEDVKPAEFPHGLKPIADACHALGLRWLMWWEPERVANGTRIQREHPEFLLGNTLFNLGDPPARVWLTQLLGRQITDFGVDCFRSDFNIDPLGFWRLNDPPDRQGMTEIRYIEGLYAMWDEIRKEHPNLSIDNCASGGRRIDLETLKRALVQSRSDAGCVPGHADWDQSQAYGLSLYVPDHSTIAWELDTYSLRSSATSGYVGEWDILDPKFPMDQARAGIKEIRENQHYWYGDYYPLTPWSFSPAAWIAYQLDCPETGDGMVLAFRHPASTQPTLTVALRGLKEDQSYQVTFIDEDRKETSRKMTGKEMAQLTLTIGDVRKSLLVRYKKASEQ